MLQRVSLGLSLLASGLLGAVVLTATVTWAAPAEVGEPSLGPLERLSLRLANAERAAQGLPALRSDPQLTSAARRHAQDMLARRYYGHRSPEGADALDRFIAAGGNAWLKVTENIAICSHCDPQASAELVRTFHRQWMESPGHRENVLDPQVTHLGFGIASGADGRQLAVQTFAGPGGPAGTDGVREAAPITPEQEQSLALDFVNRERADRSLTRLSGSLALADAARRLLSRQVEQVNESLDGQTLEGLSAKALYGLLSDAERRRWQGIGIIVIACGGCGVAPTDVDVEYFQGQWIESPRNRAKLIEGDFSHFGFAMVADGKGQKLAMAVVGKAK